MERRYGLRIGRSPEESSGPLYRPISHRHLNSHGGVLDHLKEFWIIAVVSTAFHRAVDGGIAASEHFGAIPERAV